MLEGCGACQSRHKHNEAQVSFERNASPPFPSVRDQRRLPDTHGCASGGPQMVFLRHAIHVNLNEQDRLGPVAEVDLACDTKRRRVAR